jgi:hypothetical protein
LGTVVQDEHLDKLSERVAADPALLRLDELPP